jgi:hypothetical protein
VKTLTYCLQSNPTPTSRVGETLWCNTSSAQSPLASSLSHHTPKFYSPPHSAVLQNVDPAVVRHIFSSLVRKFEALEYDDDGGDRPWPPTPAASTSPKDKPELSSDQSPYRPQRLLPDLASANLPGPSLAWDNCHPPTVAYCLEGPQAFYRSSEQPECDTTVTPEHRGPLCVGRDPTDQTHVTQDTRVSKYVCPTERWTELMLAALRKLIPFEEEERTRQRCIVITRTTHLVLSLDLYSGVDRALPFDSIRIPVTRSVKHVMDPGHRRLLSLNILLEDASSGNLLKACEICQGGGENWVTFVDFHADQNIIDLEQGKICLRFTFPCSCLDTSGQVFRYRCVCLYSDSEGHEWHSDQVQSLCRLGRHLRTQNRSNPPGHVRSAAFNRECRAGGAWSRTTPRAGDDGSILSSWKLDGRYCRRVHRVFWPECPTSRSVQRRRLCDAALSLQHPRRVF